MPTQIQFFLFLLTGLILSSCTTEPNFVDYQDVTIYRDKWGVPHIHGKTDNDVSYGLAWASCEDDFSTLQEQMLAIKGKLGEVKGQSGAVADFAIHFMGIRDYARSHIATLNEETRKVINGYCDGVNAYAALNKDKVLLAGTFPIRDYDLVAGYLMGLVEISGASEDLRKLADGSMVSEMQPEVERGSNAIAISSSKSSEGQTFLAINSHQPMEGWYSWYEAHLISDEGMNILGGTFPGGATIFHGVNENLGWAHTVNHADFSDVYKLTMHPEKEHYYKIDDQYFPLSKKVIRTWVKIAGPLKIPITRNIYESAYGITFKIDSEYYSWRYQARESIKAIEQWFQMNKATNFQEFKSALDIEGIPCTNIVYADREDNIYYISNGRHPKRNIKYDWQGVLPGDKSETLWPAEYWPIDSLPQVLNPASGYVFNTNNTPFSSSSKEENPLFQSIHTCMGYKDPCDENNRSLRLRELLEKSEKLSYRNFYDIKFDRTYPTPLKSDPYDEETLLQLDAMEYPELKDGIALLDSWDRGTQEENEAAPLFLLSREYLRQQYLKNDIIGKSDFALAIELSMKQLEAKFGKINIPLGEFQRHRRGQVDLPIGGGSDVLAAIYSKEDYDGKYRAYSGESYIMMVRFDGDREPIIETINAYGSSNVGDSPHYSDQMPLFVRQQLKPMTLDLEKTIDESVSSYHPLQLADD